MAVENQGISPALIHYKRYEEPYLRQLHHECAPGQSWPFTSILCTHEIFSALYPGHPRKSLRAVAGFLGFSLRRNRRCLDHVAATVFIWCHMVHELREREGITQLEELKDWLKDSRASSSFPRCRRDYPMKKNLLQSLPDRPGIYRMYRSTGDLLYIGKARSLKKRVNSYFYQNSRHAEHILEMLSQAQALTISETQSALEAAVRESEEIKRLGPPYNRALRPEARRIVFYSKDLKRKKPEPDYLHPVGPVLSSIQLEALPRLMDVLNGLARSITPRYMETMLNIPQGYGPDLDCFRSGLQAFQEEYVFRIERPVLLSHLMGWGTEFWQEKLEDQEAAEDTERSEESVWEKEEAEKGWTSERIFRTIKRTIRIGAFHLRRARWFCRLSESVMIWTKADRESGEKNMIIIKGGIPYFKECSISSGKLEAPRGHTGTQRERQMRFDLERYDRMRIITTEMRRLIQEGRDVELCLHPGKAIKLENLKKMLQWV